MESSLEAILGQRPRQESRPKTLGEIGALWESFIYQNRPFATYERYSRAVSRFVEAFPEKHSIHDFLRPDVLTYVEKRLAEGASVATLRTELAAIRAFFQFCEDMDFALLNPARGIRVPNRIKRPALKRQSEGTVPVEQSEESAA